MANQEITSDSKNLLDLNQLNLVVGGDTHKEARTVSAEAQDDLPLLDYPVGGVFESQNGMGNISLGSMVKRLVGWR